MCRNTREVDYLARLNSTFEKQHVSFNQLLDFNLQRETVLDVMAGSSLMEGTGEVGLIPYWKLVRHRRRRSGLDKVLLEQDGKELRICHWDWVKLHPWSLLLMLAFGPFALEMQLIFAKLPVEPPGYSVSLTRPGVLLPLHECSWISN
ncbi:transmembrane protein, putative [Medicago truncatula]|uniref:Transmembrane protein, putative n=1 Tax=Medicago truncatula TaxID=3880 RepID=A0A072UI26_MEDTR|nr:transmembrane protein, putative [Medicago truncatula]